MSIPYYVLSVPARMESFATGVHVATVPPPKTCTLVRSLGVFDTPVNIT